MQDALKRALRLAGYAVMVVAIAHCGDNGNNDNTPTPSGSRTVTPTSAVTPTRTSTPASPGSPSVTVTPTAEITPTGSPCPSGISIVGNADTARLDTGWTGLGHAAKIVDRAEISVATDCAGKARPCGVCGVTGPIANPDAGHGVSNNHRCTGDTSIECTSTADCGGNGTCEFFLGAPLPLSAGGVSTCIVNQVTGTITGTANIETGDGQSVVHLIASVFSEVTQEEPCPVCVGDPTIGDGVRGGTCSDGSTRAGMPCDVSGVSQTFEPTGKTSFDCPSASDVLAALPITLATSTSTLTKTLTNDSPDCGAGSGKCFCDTCATAAAEPCFSNADCPGGAACGGLRCIGGPNNGATCAKAGRASECPSAACSVPGTPTRSNQCDNGDACVPDSQGSLNGHCPNGPIAVFCAPHDTFIGCVTNADCQFPGDSCTGSELQPCFLDSGVIGGSVSAAGVADPPVNGVSHPTLAALFCIGPTSASAVNTAAGLPGLGRLQQPATATEIP